MTQCTRNVSSPKPVAAQLLSDAPAAAMVPRQPLMRSTGLVPVDATSLVKIGEPKLPVGSFEGMAPGMGLRDRMVLQTKRDPENPQGYYASLSEYTRRLPAVIGRLIPGLQMTTWVPRMYPYYLTHKGNDVYEVRTLHVAADGSLEPHPHAPASTLTLRKGRLKGALLERRDTDGSIEKIAFDGGTSVTTWERNLVGNYFLAIDRSGREYFEKGVNSVVKADGTLELDTHHLGGKYRMRQHAGGLFFTLESMKPNQLGANALGRAIGQGMDIVNWKPFRTTIELLLMNPDNGRDVKFFYERHDRDPKLSLRNLWALLTRRFRGQPPMTREDLAVYRGSATRQLRAS